MVEKLSVKQKPILRGEAALAVAVIVNTFGVVLMLYSESGISAISSVPFAFSLVLPQLTLGTWTYLFQGVLVLSLMLMRKRFVPQYLFSFVVGFIFGVLLDVHELWISILPSTFGWRIIILSQAIFDKSWDCTFQSLLFTHCSNRSIPKGTFSNHWHRLSQNQDRI